MRKCHGAIFLGACLLAACSAETGIHDPAALGRLAAVVETSSSQEARQILNAEGYDEESFKRTVDAVLRQPSEAAEFSQARSEIVRERIPRARAAALDDEEAVERARPVIPAPVVVRAGQQPIDWD